MTACQLEVKRLGLSKHWRPFSCSSNKTLVAAAQCPAVNPSHRQGEGESWPQALIKAKSGNCCYLETLMVQHWCPAWRNAGTDFRLCVFLQLAAALNTSALWLCSLLHAKYLCLISTCSSSNSAVREKKKTSALLR